MPLNHSDQLNMLKDILSEHLSDSNGTVSEYEQMDRLVKSLLDNDGISEEMKQQLQEIQSYSEIGKQSMDSQEHIFENQNNLNQWIEGMDQFF